MRFANRSMFAYTVAVAFSLLPSSHALSQVRFIRSSLNLARSRLNDASEENK
jgi:hypothetical protein